MSQEFGEDVTTLVVEVSDDKTLEAPERNAFSWNPPLRTVMARSELSSPPRSAIGVRSGSILRHVQTMRARPCRLGQRDRRRIRASPLLASNLIMPAKRQELPSLAVSPFAGPCLRCPISFASSAPETAMQAQSSHALATRKSAAVRSNRNPCNRGSLRAHDAS